MQVSQTNRYNVGVAQTDAQIAELKTDIVWLVKQNVTLADGSTQVQAAQDIVNSGGTIAGRQSVSLAGNNVQNLGGASAAVP